MELSHNEGVNTGSNRRKREAALQIRLAKRLYGTEDVAAALNSWAQDHKQSPSALFRTYLESHPATNLEATSPEELDRILEESGIRSVLH